MSDLRLLWLTILLLPILGWSGVGPHDRVTWFLEIAPVVIGLPIAWAVAKRFPLSTLLLVLLGIHAVILIVGGHYTYARVPLGDWVGQWFGWTRNNYDKLGHFAQGFIPAILVREILLRRSPLRWESIAVRSTDPEEPPPAAKVEHSKWLGFLVVSVCLAFSAFYELIEWWAALLGGAAADEFLGTQGYIWDTQSDMAWALGGAILALLLLSGVHDRSLLKVEEREAQRRDDY